VGQARRAIDRAKRAAETLASPDASAACCVRFDALTFLEYLVLRFASCLGPSFRLSDVAALLEAERLIAVVSVQTQESQPPQVAVGPWGGTGSRGPRSSALPQRRSSPFLGRRRGSSSGNSANAEAGSDSPGTAGALVPGLANGVASVLRAVTTPKQLLTPGAFSGGGAGWGLFRWTASTVIQNDPSEYPPQSNSQTDAAGAVFPVQSPDWRPPVCLAPLTAAGPRSSKGGARHCTDGAAHVSPTPHPEKDQGQGRDHNGAAPPPAGSLFFVPDAALHGTCAAMTPALSLRLEPPQVIRASGATRSVLGPARPSAVADTFDTFGSGGGGASGPQLRRGLAAVEFQVDQIVCIVKEGSSLFGAKALVIDPNYVNGTMVQVTSLSTLVLFYGV